MIWHSIVLLNRRPPHCASSGRRGLYFDEKAEYARQANPTGKDRRKEFEERRWWREEPLLTPVQDRANSKCSLCTRAWWSWWCAWLHLSRSLQTLSIEGRKNDIDALFNLSFASLPTFPTYVVEVERPRDGRCRDRGELWKVREGSK
jgi:hypothetical protein